MRKFLALVLALVMTMSLVTVSAGAATDFTDDAKIVNAEAVEVLNAMGVLGGYDDGSFRPQGTLTRGAGAKLLAYLMLGQEKADNLKAALEKSGFEVNATLWDWYNSEEGVALKEASAEGGTGGENATLGGQAPISEIDPASYPADVADSIAAYGDAAIITFSRVGGEGYDCAFPGYVDGNGVTTQFNYLALNDAERALMAYADGLKKEGKISSIIVLINTSNSLQVDFLKDYDVDACLWVGGLGISGTNAVTDILAGKVNPSGSLVDTYCYDNLSSPAMHNYLALKYANFDGQVPDQASSYMVYQEGIYVGYKYYETRYQDEILGINNANGSKGVYASQNGAWNYADEMVFTFGAGMSYADFTQELLSVEWNKDIHTVTASQVFGMEEKEEQVSHEKEKRYKKSKASCQHNK